MIASKSPQRGVLDKSLCHIAASWWSRHAILSRTKLLAGNHRNERSDDGHLDIAGTGVASLKHAEETCGGKTPVPLLEIAAMIAHLSGIRKTRGNHRPSLHKYGPRRLTLEALESRLALATSYIATDLVSDESGVAPITDETLHNAWGIAVGPLTFWVSSEGGGISEVYSGDVGSAPLVKNPLEVTIPGGEPTGQVFNSTSDFVVSAGGASAPALFIFASQSGSITGWNPGVPPPPPATEAHLGFQASDGAAYTGIALASNGGANFLYAADFKNGKIDVLDASYQPTTLAGSFTDPDLPEDYAPFNVAAINGQLYVAYAPREVEGDEAEEIAGRGNGLIDIFTTDGQFVERLF
jgi:hypothetical protein